MDGNLLLKFFGVILLSSFLPLTAYLFNSNYLPNKKENYNKLLKALDLKASDTCDLITIVEDKYSGKDYFFPVGFVTLLCVLWSVTLLFGADLELAKKPHILLSGSQVLSVDDISNLPKKIVDYQQISMLVMLLSMLGAYLWAMQNIIVRLTTVDLPPPTYFSIAIRMLLATFVALMIRFMWGSPEVDNGLQQSAQFLPGDGNYDALLVFSFLSGMFPERAIQYLKDKIPTFSKRFDNSKSDDLPLSMIEGINMFHKVRLAEIGIDNAQNLAETNLVEILIRTPFRPKRVIDWIAQSWLYIYFKSDIKQLRAIGIRTIFDYKITAKDEKKLKEIAEATELSELQLSNVYNQIKDNTILIDLENASSKLKVI